jgi:hypothetical protein
MGHGRGVLAESEPLPFAGGALEKAAPRSKNVSSSRLRSVPAVRVVVDGSRRDSAGRKPGRYAPPNRAGFRTPLPALRLAGFRVMDSSGPPQLFWARTLARWRTFTGQVAAASRECQSSKLVGLCTCRHHDAGHVRASRASVCNHPRLGSQGIDPHDLPHRRLAPGTCTHNLTGTSQDIRHKSPVLAGALFCRTNAQRV